MIAPLTRVCFIRGTMTLLHLTILAIVQGITEFLPISSSGHLILVGEWFKHMGEQDQGLALDVGTHLGTLAAVMVYFHTRVAQIFRGLWAIATRRRNADATLVTCLIIGTIPGLIGGALILLIDDSIMRHIPIIIVTSVVFGALLWVADTKSPQDKTIDTDLSLKHAALIGLAQMVALIPGTSRSGITMTTARFLGYQRQEAARFSFLLSIPVTAAAVLAVLAKLLLKHDGEALVLHDFFIVAAMTFVVALGAIHYLLKWLATHNFTPFVIYRFLLAALLTWWIF
jgi:undecaprenyl-diphosphatase